MAVGDYFGTQVFQSLQGKEVEVALVGGPRSLVEGKLYTAQKDYVMVSTGDGSAVNTFVIPSSAIAYIRQTKS
jgi:hypothetical protein